MQRAKRRCCFQPTHTPSTLSRMVSRTLLFLLAVVGVLSIASSAHAFGAGKSPFSLSPSSLLHALTSRSSAGNIPSVAFYEGKAFRHGDIEDILADMAKKVAHPFLFFPGSLPDLLLSAGLLFPRRKLTISPPPLLCSLARLEAASSASVPQSSHPSTSNASTLETGVFSLLPPSFSSRSAPSRTLD